jgi:CheY-like chemotaxis protein
LNGDREKALMSGCNDYLAKPIQRETLADLVHQYLKKKED